ncbi:DHA2 family efflux MFS transporter permease subunit [Streptomyces sp. NPDC046197]|uniref:DHA2 family efflux MFS transporter permease subunit n=1 Tax=Streptomyces sp. NPDC046197 TaxID=3154337 RepID=UPI003402AF03
MASIRSWRGNPWATLTVVSVGYFMPLLDLTIVNIAIPDLVSDLRMSLDQILWVINGYTLALAALLIAAGRLGDLRGPRAAFAAGTALFTVASVACALAADPAQLIAFRAVQGVGAAVLVPQTLTLLAHSFPPERRGTAFGIWGAVAGLAAVAGPTLGGLLVTALGWRWIFLINLPIGVAVLAATLALVDDVRETRPRRLNLLGVLLCTLALTALCYGLIEGRRYDWGTVTSFVSIPLVLAVGVVLLALFLWNQARVQRDDPLIPFVLFKDREYALMNVVGGAVNVGMLGFLLLFNLYLQSALGMSALRAGLTLAPAAVVSMLLAPLTGRLTDRVDGRWILFGGLLLFAAGMAWMAAAAGPDSPWYAFLPPLVVAGVGMGGTFAPMPAIAMQGVPPALNSAASGVFNSNRQFGSVLGTAAVGALLQGRLVAAVGERAAERARTLPPGYRAQFTTAVRRGADGAIEGGAGHSALASPPGVPRAVAGQLEAAGRYAMTHGLVDAVHQSVVLPVGVTALAALCALAVRPAANRLQDPSDLRMEVTSV